MTLADLQASVAAMTRYRSVARHDLLAHLRWSGRLSATAGAGDDEAALAGLLTRGEARLHEGRGDLVETTNLLTVEGMAGRIPFWRACEVEAGRGLVRALLGCEGGRAPQPGLPLAPRRFTVTLERTFHLAGMAAGSRLRLRLPRPIEDGQLHGIAIATHPSARLLPGRIEHACIADGAATAVLAATCRFTSDPERPLAGGSPADRAIWLRPEEGAIRVTPRIRALAGRLAAGRDDAAALAAFRDHLLDTFACGMLHHDPAGATTAEWVLDHGWFDCALGAALLASLCRARGIPARIVGGYLLWAAPAEHFWMEAWLPGRGWVAHDLLAWGLSAGGRDADWRGIFAGAVDYRMKTQVFPRLFVGAPGVAAPGPVQRLCSTIEGGTRMRFQSARDGRDLYTDDVRVTSG